MRNMRLLPLILGIFLNSGLGFCQNGLPPFSISISTVKATVPVGTGVWLNVQMTNTSDHPVDCSSVYVGGTDRRFQYDVRDESGASMKKPNMHPERASGSIQMCTLKPGETVSHETLVSWLHDFSRPGRYSIQLMRGATDDENDGVVKSNTITITVIR